MKDRALPADPRRVEIGRINRTKWNGFSEAGLERLRQSALLFRPSRFATGPRTLEGKAKCAANGRSRCRGDLSIPQARAEVARANVLLADLAELRKALVERMRPGARLARSEALNRGCTPFSKDERTEMSPRAHVGFLVGTGRHGSQAKWRRAGFGAGRRARLLSTSTSYPT